MCDASCVEPTLENVGDCLTECVRNGILRLEHVLAVFRRYGERDNRARVRAEGFGDGCIRIDERLKMSVELLALFSVRSVDVF